jgi:hypothetical protein
MTTEYINELEQSLVALVILVAFLSYIFGGKGE